MYSKVEISNIVVRGVEVKKSEIRLKSENLHPCTGLDKSGVRTPGTTRKRFWATRLRGLVAQRTTKIFLCFFVKYLSLIRRSML